MQAQILLGILRSDNEKGGVTGHERRLEESPGSLGRGDYSSVVRLGPRWRWHDWHHGLDDERLHDGRWFVRHAVCAAVLGAGHSPDRRTGGLDRQPDPAAPLNSEAAVAM